MALKFLFVVLLNGICFCGYTQNNVGKISKLLSKYQDDKIGSFKKMTFYQVRERLFTDYPSLFKEHGDTLFFLEKYDIENATYYGRIWDNRDTVNYSFFAYKVSILKRSYFTDKSIEWLSKWDTVSLRKEELHYDAPKRIYGARYIALKSKFIIDTIRFKEFILDEISS